MTKVWNNVPGIRERDDDNWTGRVGFADSDHIHGTRVTEIKQVLKYLLEAMRGPPLPEKGTTDRREPLAGIAIVNGADGVERRQLQLPESVFHYIYADEPPTMCA